MYIIYINVYARMAYVNREYLLLRRKFDLMYPAREILYKITEINQKYRSKLVSVHTDVNDRFFFFGFIFYFYFFK